MYSSAPPYEQVKSFDTLYVSIECLADGRRTHDGIVEVEVEQIFILDLSHLDDSFVVQPLLVAFYFAPHQLVLLVGMKAAAHGQLDRGQLLPAMENWD